MAGTRYRTWAVSLLHPVDRLVPGIGARLGGFPRLAPAVLTTLQRLPTRRLRAFAYWRVSRPLVRRLEGHMVLRGVGGVRMLADAALERGLAASGTWEWNVGLVIRDLVRPGDVFVDVGANAGYYSLLAARAVGPGGHVYAVEPAPGTAAALRRNVALNGLEERVTVVEAAAGARREVATLYGRTSGHDMTSSLIRQPDGTTTTATEVEVLPVAEVLRPEHRQRVRLVKVDVEGHEDQAVVGLDQFFVDGSRPALVVEVHTNFNPAAAGAVSEFAARHNLDGYLLLDNQTEMAPRDRQLDLRRFEFPPALEEVETDRFNVLLRPR